MLPMKNTLKNWTCEPVIERLMSDHKWPRHIAKQWFDDFMCWLYSSHKWRLENSDSLFIMDNLHYLDDVWHAYILHIIITASCTVFADGNP